MQQGFVSRLIKKHRLQEFLKLAIWIPNPWKITSYLFLTIPISFICIISTKFLLLHPGSIIISGTGARIGIKIIKYSIPFFRTCNRIKPVLYWIVLKQEVILK